MPGWPAHAEEPRRWTTSADNRAPGGSRPPRLDRVLTEIRVVIPPFVKDRDPVFARRTRELLEAATIAVSRLDQAAPSNLAATSGFLLRSESVASSKIERVYAESEDMAMAFAGREASKDALQVVAASVAVTALIETPHPLTVEALDTAHHLLFRGHPTEGQHAGTVRTVQNWIGGSDYSPRGAVHVPPPPDLVPALLGDLVAFANRRDFGAVGQAAIVHAQFESVHPYTDGNGRIGRALLNTVLRHRAVTSRMAVPIASSMLADIDTYFARLGSYRAGDVDTWVSYVAEATVIACDEAAESVRTLSMLPQQWRDRIRASAGSAAQRTLEVALESPVLTSTTVVERLGVTRRTALTALERLAAGGVLAEVGGRKERVWIADDVIDEIDDLQDRIGRRASFQVP